jgi:hypothetical protein
MTGRMPVGVAIAGLTLLMFGEPLFVWQVWQE